VAVDGDRLAVVGPAHGRGLSGALVYDVSDPAAPRQVAFHETGFAIHNCDLSAGHLYLTGNDGANNPLVVVAVDGATEVARWSLVDVEPRWQDAPLSNRMLHDVTVADGVAYAAYWDAGTWLVDVSTPADPRPLGRTGGYTAGDFLALDDVEKAFQSTEPPGNAHYADVNDDGTLLAVGGESWDARLGDGHGGPSGIDLYDVSDPAAPEPLATVEPLQPKDGRVREGVWTTAHNFELTGDRLYSSWYQNGVKVHDVSDPSAPVKLAHWRDPAGTRFWTAQLARPGEFFVASDMGGRGEHPEGGAVYTFPDRAGTQSEMPAIETATPTATPSSTASESPTPFDTPPSPAGTPTDTEPEESRPAATETTSPGFGVLGGLAALVVAACRWRRDGD
jgi:PGF-CTERM protein